MDEDQLSGFKKLEFDSDDWNKYSALFSDAESAQMQNFAFTGGTVLYKIEGKQIRVAMLDSNGKHIQIISTSQ